MEFQDTDSKWWLANGDQHEGPFSVDEILARVTQSELRNDHLACPVGGSEWKPLREWDVFAEKTDDSELIPPPPPLPSQKPDKTPWNPILLWYLGFLFTPLWLGIMTAINGKRLEQQMSTWGPVGLGISWLVADIISEQFFPSSFIISVLMLGVFAFAFWHLFLQKQLDQCQSITAKYDAQSNWLVPCIAGTPLALLQMAGFAIAFMPVGPRDVCSDFLAADTPDEAKQYATPNMAPIIRQFELLETLAKQNPDLQEEDAEIEYFKLTDESEALPHIGGYLVGYRANMPDDNGKSFTMDGFFHLLEIDGEWKIDSWIITHIDNQLLDNGPTSMVTFFKGITDEMQRQIDQSTSTTTDKSPLKQDYSIYNYGITPTNNSSSPVSTKKTDPQNPAHSNESEEQPDKKGFNIRTMIVSFLQSIFGEVGGRIVFFLIVIGAIYCYSNNKRS